MSLIVGIGVVLGMEAARRALSKQVEKANDEHFGALEDFENSLPPKEEFKGYICPNCGSFNGDTTSESVTCQGCRNWLTESDEVWE